MKKARIGEHVRNIRVHNPKAVEIVNHRAQRDHICAGTAAALIIIESAIIPQRRSFKQAIIEKSTTNLE